MKQLAARQPGVYINLESLALTPEDMRHIKTAIMFLLRGLVALGRAVDAVGAVAEPVADWWAEERLLWPGACWREGLRFWGKVLGIKKAPVRGL